MMNIGPWFFGGFDAIVLGILAFSGILAFVRGLSREIISILALLIGLAGALFVFGRYSIDAQNFIKPGWLANAILFFAVYGILHFIVTFALRGWGKLMRNRTPGFLDRLLGFAYGVFRGAILASLFVLVVSQSAKDGEPAAWMTQTATYPMLRTISDTIQRLPFARAQEIAGDIKTKGEESDMLPDIPQPDQ